MQVTPPTSPITVWVAVLAFLTPIELYVLDRLRRRSDDKRALKIQNALVHQAEQVKSTLVATGDRVEGKVDHIKALVNGNMGAALKRDMEKSERIAGLTNLPADIEDAAKCREAFESHQKDQDDANSLSTGPKCKSEN